MSTINSRIVSALHDADACHALRMLVGDLVREGVPRHALNREFLDALARLPADGPKDYQFVQELEETLELFCLWTSNFHPEFPEPWFSEPGFERGKAADVVSSAEAWLRKSVSQARNSVFGDD